MIEEKTWEEFRDSGLLWWVNNILCVFGWSIVITYENEKIIRVAPARTAFRGFSEKINTQGYIKVSKYLFIKIVLTNVRK